MEHPGNLLSVAENPEDEIVAELDLEIPVAVAYSTLHEGGSWPFRCAAFCWRVCAAIFGLCSTIFLLAVLANIPILQLIAFGYLLDSSGRVARGQKFRTQFSGMHKATRAGGMLLGAWLLLWPMRLAYGFWADAAVIDPGSQQTTFLMVLSWFLTIATVSHIVAAVLCGGKLRYFFWPLIAPFSLGIWIVRRSRVTRQLLSLTIGWLSPKLVADICNSEPMTDWFLPAIFLKRLFTENLFQATWNSLSEFVHDLQLPKYFMLGLKGLFGTLCWLAIPTLALAGSTSEEAGVAGLCLLIGIVVSVPVFALLPFVQAHFATDGKLRKFFQPLQVMRLFSRAPMAHLTGLLLILLLALPLFLLKIEQVPKEFLWTLSLLFIAFGWPSRMIAGWASGRGAKKERPVRWWLRYPIQFFAAPISFLFAVIFYLTRYISWNGTLSLLENHVFLLPAPFWLGG